MRLIIFVILFLNSATCFSFDWDKCKKVFKGSNNLISASTAATGSSSSYLSSTGDCAMIGMVNHDKKVFLVHNFKNMKNDSARGAGEYIEAYAIVSMCDYKARNELSKAFQKNFTYIYGESIEKEPEQAYEAMERLMKKDSILASGCYRKM